MFNSKIFTKLLLLFVCMLIIPTFLIGMINFSVTTTVVEEQFQQMNLTSVAKVRDVFDRTFHDVKSVATLLNSLPFFSRLAYMSTPVINNEIRINSNDIIDIIAVLRYNRYNNRLLDNIAFVSQTLDMVVDCDSRYTIHDYFNIKYTISSPTEGRIKNIDWDKKFDTIYGYTAAKYDGSKEKNVIVQKIGLPLSENYSGAMLVFIMRTDHLLKLIEDNTISNYTNLAVLNGEGEIVVSSGEYNSDLIHKIANKSLAGNEHHNNVEYIYYILDSDYNGYKYIAYARRSDVSGKVGYIKKATCILAAICIVIGIILAFIFAKTNYKPIKDLAGSVVNLPLPNEHGMVDEISEIRKVFTFLHIEKKDMISKIEQYAPVVKNSLLMRLLKRMADKDDINALRNFGPVFDREFIITAAMVLEISEISDDNRMGNATASSIITEHINNYFITSREMCYVVQEDILQYYLILNTSYNSYRYIKKIIEELIVSIEGLFGQYYEIAVNAAIGGMYNSYESIADSADEAKEAMKYMTYHNTKVICYDELDENIVNEFKFDTDAVKTIASLLKEGEGDKLDSYIDDIISHTHMINRINSGEAYLLLELLSSAAARLDKTYSEEQTMIDFNRLTQINDYNERIDYIKKAYRNFSKKMNRTYCVNDEIINSISTFVDEHYHDDTISLTTLSNHFMYSTVYISKLFKERLGCNFIDYLNRKRIGKAKELLIGENLLIKTIANTTGFDSDKNFRRVFKKYEHISPSEYRKKMLLEGKLKG